MQERNAQSQWNAAMVALREVVGFWGVGASFIITGEGALAQSICPLDKCIIVDSLDPCTRMH